MAPSAWIVLSCAPMPAKLVVSDPLCPEMLPSRWRLCPEWIDSNAQCNDINSDFALPLTVDITWAAVGPIASLQGSSHDLSRWVDFTLT